MEKCWLKALGIQVCRQRSWSELCDYTAQWGSDKEMALYKAFVQPFRGMTGKLTVLGREAMLDN